MAEITINVNTANGLVFTRVISLKEEDVVRILTAANDRYLGDTSKPPIEELIKKSDLVFNKAVDIFFGEIRRMTRGYEVDLARSAAEDSVPTIEEIPSP